MRGGNREGAGRKAGTANKVTVELQRAVAESGVTPLDFLLETMRDEAQSLEVRFEAAKAAAPYVHPKLSAIQHNGALSFMSHEEALDQLS